MPTRIRRLIFGSLFFLFIIFTIAVDTVGTDKDSGSFWLNEKAKNGKLVFQENNCTACHQLYGLGGYMGPDLTNVISAKGKGPLYVKAFLQSGTQRMPDFHFSETQMEELIAYLTYVDQTGVSPVKKFKTNFDGTISVVDVKK